MVLEIITCRWKRTSWRQIAFGYLSLKTGIILDVSSLLLKHVIPFTIVEYYKPRK